jgi:hypothetical protein
MAAGFRRLEAERQFAVIAITRNRRRALLIDQTSVMQVPGRMAPGLTFGASLSQSTQERPCASLPVTTRRIGLILLLIAFSCSCTLRLQPQLLDEFAHAFDLRTNRCRRLFW